MRLNTLFNTVRPFVSALAVLSIALALVFTVYFTLVSIQWVAFLTGVLMAAVLAEATRVSRAEWVLVRRTAQLSALKDKFEKETQRRKSAEETVAVSKSRLHLVDEVLPTMVAFVDAEGVCRYHNRAFRNWLHFRPEQINGHHINEILGPKVYQEIASYVRQALDGHSVNYERTQKMPNGAVYKLAVEHLPQSGEGGKTVGFYMLTDDITEPSDVIAAAHVQSGKSDQELFVNAFSEQITGQKDAAADIVAAIEKNEFRLFGQQITPLMATPANAEYYEILVRLMEEEEGMIPPGAFFPLAEKHGMMAHLDRWVVQRVAERVAMQMQQKTWKEGSVFFINVAEATLLDHNFPDYLDVTLMEYGVPGGVLCFEIPNTELVQKNAEVVEFAQRVSHHGCLIALSGFGRDKVSFDMIRGIKIEYLKIDGNVVLNMLRDPVQLAKVTAINQVAKKIGFKTIAEFVENDEIIAKLKEIGVDFAQGFGISKPQQLEQ